MKIVTVNLPQSDIKNIANLVGENGLYPSRSELIRVAIREFLIKELDIARNFSKYNSNIPKINNFIHQNSEESSDNLFVRIPTNNSIGLDTAKEYKTYKIIKR
ncbi:MAG: type II toxin-antitoxin system ParD family antitoxin [archaeon]|nr:type II toxin-antitoxin system ParD family antitoxin [archaeon]